MFLLELPGDKVGVRYSHGSLDRAVQLQDSLETMVEDFRAWSKSKVGLVILLLGRDEWQGAGLSRPYGVPEPAGGRGLAVPAWGDDGTVEVWKQLLGTRLPTLPDQPLRGTPEQVASLAVGDLMASLDAARIMLRASGTSGDQPWVDGVLAHSVVLSHLQVHKASRMTDVRMIFSDLAANGGGPEAFPLSASSSPPSLSAGLWFESQYHVAANLLVGPRGKFPIKAIFKQARKNGGRISGAELLARCPELDTWLQSAFRSG